ncbi:shikimate kinase [Luedemannella flava]|uniref:shikimate kinase n=1 Tax=Luedemannella flava TaxID=349316 RepID=UPI0031E26B50
MRRVVVVGNAGSGKTTLGRRLGEALGVPFVELDSIFHQEGWRPLPEDLFRARVLDIVAADAWVIDGNYRVVRDLVWARADTVVWFDLPRRTVMRQVVLRTLRRMATRQVLWNGNREPVSGLFRLDPEHSIIRLAWLKHATYHERFAAAAADPRFAHLRFVRIGSRADATTLVATADG